MADHTAIPLAVRVVMRANARHDYKGVPESYKHLLDGPSKNRGMFPVEPFSCRALTI